MSAKCSCATSVRCANGEYAHRISGIWYVESPTNSRLIHGSASGAGGDEQRTQRWYRRTKETQRGEMGGRESQHLIVPLKRGNQPEGPRRGKGVPSHEPLKRNLAGPS